MTAATASSPSSPSSSDARHGPHGACRGSRARGGAACAPQPARMAEPAHPDRPAPSRDLAESPAQNLRGLDGVLGVRINPHCACLIISWRPDLPLRPDIEQALSTKLRTLPPPEPRSPRRPGLARRPGQSTRDAAVEHRGPTADAVACGACRTDGPDAGQRTARCAMKPQTESRPASRRFASRHAGSRAPGSARP